MAELDALADALPDIAAAGASLVVLSPQVERLGREPADQKPLPFTFVRDRGNRVATSYGLTFALPEDLREVYRKIGVDLPKANGDDSWTLPMPARFVIDRAGIIRAADVDPDYTRRPEPSATVAALRGLRSGG